MKRKRPGTGGFAGFEVNRPDTLPLALMVGKLLINCGAIELLSLVWPRELATDPVVLDLAIDLPLSRRIDLVLNLAERKGLPTELLERLRVSWQEARSVSEVRNLVAHSPLTFGWKGAERPGPPDYIGIPALRDMRRNASGRVRIAPIDGLAKAVDASARIATSLSAMLDEVIGFTDSPADQPTGAP